MALIVECGHCSAMMNKHWVTCAACHQPVMESFLDVSSRIEGNQCRSESETIRGDLLPQIPLPCQVVQHHISEEKEGVNLQSISIGTRVWYRIPGDSERGPYRVELIDWSWYGVWVKEKENYAFVYYGVITKVTQGDHE